MEVSIMLYKCTYCVFTLHGIMHTGYRNTLMKMKLTLYEKAYLPMGAFLYSKVRHVRRSRAPTFFFFNFTHPTRLSSLYFITGYLIFRKVNFKGVLHPWASFWKTLCIFAKNTATLDKLSNVSD